MAQLASGDVVEVRIGCFADQQASYNVRHMNINSIDLGVPTTGTLAVAIDTTIAPLMKNLITGDGEYIGIGVRRLTPTATIEIAVIPNKGPGLGGSPAMAKQTAGVVTLLSDTPGSRGRGRMYIPFPSELSNGLNGKPDALYDSNLNTLADNFVGQKVWTDGSNTVTVTNVIRSTKSLKAPGINLYDITLRNSRPRWGTQRRRSDFGAINAQPFS